MTVADSFALELVGQEQLTISLGSGAPSQLERARVICARLAEIFGCPWEESETVLPPQH